MPILYYRQLFYPFSPISQMFYYSETAELLNQEIEAPLFQGAPPQTIGCIWKTTNLQQT